MSAENGFNNQIKELLKSNSDSKYSQIITKIRSNYPNKNSDYNIMDIFSYSLGVGFVNQRVVNSSENKTLGYLPKLKYHNGNIFGKTGGEEDVFVSNLTPLSIEKSYGIIAKEFIYLLSSIPNIFEVIESRKN